MKKRVLSIALVLTLVFGLFTAFNASAAVDSQPESDSEEIKNMGEGLHFFDFEEQGRVKDTANQPQNVQYLNDSEDVGPIFITDKDDIFYGGCKLISESVNCDENHEYHCDWAVGENENVSSEYTKRIKTQISKALSYVNAPYAPGMLSIYARLNRAKFYKETTDNDTGEPTLSIENCDAVIAVEIECYDKSKSIKKTAYLQNGHYSVNTSTSFLLDVSGITAEDIYKINISLRGVGIEYFPSYKTIDVDCFDVDLDISPIFVPYISKMFTYKNFSDGSVYIDNYDGNIERLTIPNELDGKTVSAIGSYSFLDSNRMRSVDIPDTVVSIRSGAFFGCERLKNISIPDSVRYIGPDAFLDTAAYTNNDNWEDGLLYIGDNLITGYRESYNSHTGKFSFVSSVEDKCEIRRGTRLIASNAFIDCKKLHDVTIPASVKYICSHAVGYRYIEETNRYVVKSNLTIHCFKNSVAEKYAKNNGINYEIIEGTFGDANRDDNIDLLDVLQVRKYIAKQLVETDYDLSDVNCDGAVDMLDVLLVRKYIAKQPVTLGPQG